MTAIQYTKRFFQKGVRLRNGGELKDGTNQAHARSTQIQKEKVVSKTISPSVVFLISIMTLTTLLSFSNTVFFEQILACDFIVLAAIFLKKTGYSNRK